ncbi:unnamed protein product [Meganyctiphanes norvegica]|uniref:BHLH domain-containing protein n=1 Tax=Meganyctiphanes norvegica TaxID=48144 RepID=A0AAV2S814_MEGNR
MIESMKQQHQATSAAATVVATQASSTAMEAHTVPTIATAVAASKPMPPPSSHNLLLSVKTKGGKAVASIQQKTNNSLLRLHPVPAPSPASFSSAPGAKSGSVYVSRVSNFLISQCSSKASSYVNKRVCLDSSAINANTAKVSKPSFSGFGLGMMPGAGGSSTRFFMVRRGGSSQGSGGGNLCWPPPDSGPAAPYASPATVLHQLGLTTTTSAANTPRLATTITTSLPPAAPSINRGVQEPGTVGPPRGKCKDATAAQAEHKERRHMKAINDAFQVLRRALPWMGGTAAEQRPLGTAASKINTIRLAVRYIRALEHLLEDDDSEDDDSSHSETTSSSSSCSPSPALSRTSLRSVGSDFSDLLSSDSFDDLDALDELAALSEVDPDALMSNVNEKIAA